MTANATSTAPINFTFKAPAACYCPGCGAGLTQRTWTVNADILWCIRCGELPYAPLSWLGIAIAWRPLAHLWLHVRGILVWTPQEPEDGIVTHYLRVRKTHVDYPISDSLAREILAQHERQTREKRGDSGTRSATNENHSGTRSVPRRDEK